MNAQVRKHFTRYRTTPLHAMIQTIVQNLLTDIIHTQKGTTQTNLRWHETSCQTLDTAGFEKVVAQATRIIHQKMIKIYPDNGHKRRRVQVRVAQIRTSNYTCKYRPNLLTSLTQIRESERTTNPPINVSRTSPQCPLKLKCLHDTALASLAS